jgi:hypothetical protein
MSEWFVGVVAVTVELLWHTCGVGPMLILTSEWIYLFPDGL